MLGKKAQITFSFPEGWNLYFDHIQTIKKVLSEIVGNHFIFKVFVGCGNDPDIH